MTHRWLLLSLFVPLVLASPGAARAADVPPGTLVVVVGQATGVTDLTTGDLRRMYLGESVSSGATTLVPFNASPNSAERNAFEKLALGMSSDELGRFWVDRKIRGQSDPPRALPSPAYVVKVVAKFPAALSYITVDKITPETKPVKIDGKTYTDPGYPLAAR
jgi:hypothetical protein